MFLPLPITHQEDAPDPKMLLIDGRVVQVTLQWEGIDTQLEEEYANCTALQKDIKKAVIARLLETVTPDMPVTRNGIYVLSPRRRQWSIASKYKFYEDDKLLKSSPVKWQFTVRSLPNSLNNWRTYERSVQGHLCFDGNDRYSPEDILVEKTPSPGLETNLPCSSNLQPRMMRQMVPPKSKRLCTNDRRSVSTGVENNARKRTRVEIVVETRKVGKSSFNGTKNASQKVPASGKVRITNDVGSHSIETGPIIGAVNRRKGTPLMEAGTFRSAESASPTPMPMTRGNETVFATPERDKQADPPIRKNFSIGPTILSFMSPWKWNQSAKS